MFTGATALTTAVGADVAEADPAELLAVTSTRIVEPTSALTTPYVLLVAPAMSTQLPPPLSHRRH